MNKLYTQAAIKADGDSFTAIASSEVQDRQGEVVEQSGWDLKDFKNNPILLWMHDHTKPLGKATRVWLDKTGAKPLLKFKGVISTATDYGAAAKQLMDEGILNSFSVGFIPLEKDGNTITKSQLLEISLVSVPANPEARLLAYKSLEGMKFQDKSVFKELGLEEEHKNAQMLKEIEDLKKRVDNAEEKAELAVKGLKYLNPQKGRNRSVLNDRQTLSKVIAKAADKLLAEPNSNKSGLYVKLIKSSSEQLIRSHKEELKWDDTKNSLTSEQKVQ